VVKLIGSSLLEESREGDEMLEAVEAEVVRTSSQDDEEDGVLVDERSRLLNAGGPPSSGESRGYP